MAKLSAATDRWLSTARPRPLVVVVGETASGKSSLAMQAAKRFNGEIISADSRMIYRGLDIGTAKPSQADQRAVKHHLLDVVNPDQQFSVAEYKKLAVAAIADISKRSKLPLLIGGSGLYVDAVLFDYDFGPKPKKGLREYLASLTLEQLQTIAMQGGFTGGGSRSKNRRHLIRLIETGKLPVNNRSIMRGNTFVAGLKLPRQILRQNIQRRVESMFRRGLRKEVDELVRTYGWNSEALTAIGYREFKAFYSGQQSMASTKRTIVKNTLNYAKRQRTWFKRNQHILWFEHPKDVLTSIEHFIRKYNK